MRVSVFQLISKSEKSMGAVHPRLKALAIELIKRAYYEGINIRITAGHRTHAEQQRLYNQGRFGNPGNIVTNARPGESIHNFGLAIDYVLVDEKDTDAFWTVNKQWRRVAAIGKQLGFQWGGDWKSFRDYPHLDLQRGMSLANLRAGKLPSLPAVPTRPYLGQGDTGSEVSAMQSALNRAGFTTDVDGTFGQGTESALREFQSANGLTVDGLYGAAAKRMLGSSNMVAGDNPIKKEEGNKMWVEFSSPTLQEEFKTFLESKAQQTIAVQYGVDQGYMDKWLTDEKAKPGDKAMLGLGGLIRAAKAGKL